MATPSGNLTFASLDDRLNYIQKVAEDASPSSGTSTVAAGGTGRASLTAHDVLVGNGTSAVTLVAPGTSGLPLISQGAAADPTYGQISLAAAATGTLPATSFPALTGDVTTTAGSVATALATVNSNVGTFGDATHVAQLTVNAKGLATAATNVAVALTATGDATGTLPGALTLAASGVTAASYGDATHTTQVTFDAKGRATTATSTAIALNATGDVTGTLPGALTIAAGAVTLADHANLAANSIVGNNTGAPATPAALTAAQAKTLLAISTSDVSGLGTIATQAASSVAITGGSVTGLATFHVADNIFTVQNASDATKQALFSAASIATGTTRTFTLPDRTDTIATLSDIAAAGAPQPLLVK